MHKSICFVDLYMLFWLYLQFSCITEPKGSLSPMLICTDWFHLQVELLAYSKKHFSCARPHAALSHNVKNPSYGHGRQFTLHLLSCIFNVRFYRYWLKLNEKFIREYGPHNLLNIWFCTVNGHQRITAVWLFKKVSWRGPTDVFLKCQTSIKKRFWKSQIDRGQF